MARSSARRRRWTRANRAIDLARGAAAVEIELKFQIPAVRRQALHRAVATAQAQTTRMQAVYAETADRRLAAAGLALRLRKEGRVWVQTLKGRGDDLMSRLEHEVQLPTRSGVPTLDPQRHAGTPAGEALFNALRLPDGELAPLLPLYRTDIKRLHRRLRSGGALIEIAYDSGHIIAGDVGAERRVVVDEIEFELISGPPTALVALAQRWAQRFDLWWDSRTKSERGFRLALQMPQVPAVKAQAVVWPADARPPLVWQAALRSALAQALPNASELAAGDGTPEHLHQLRVALRRLRSFLRALSPWGDAEQQAQALEAAWRVPFALLGTARDADVQAQGMRPHLAAAGAPDFAWPASEQLVDLPAMLRGSEFTALMLHTLAFTVSPPAPSSAVVADAAHQLLRSSWRQVLKDAAGFAQASTADQHRTRKRLKRFRYLLEVLAPLFKPKPTRKLLRRVGQALDALGELNDLQTAAAICRTQAAVEPAAWFAVGWLAARQPLVLAAAAAALSALAAAPRVRAC
jgi:triphosphatase